MLGSSDYRIISRSERVMRAWIGGRLAVLSVFVLVGGVMLASGRTAGGLAGMALAAIYVPVRSLRDRQRP
jgi:hypothetical protein